MIDALEFKRHKAASALFVAFNVLAVVLWVLGLMLTTAFIVKTDPAPIPMPNARGVAFYNQNVASTAQAFNEGIGFARNVTATILFTAYGFAGLLSLFFGHAIRYLASIAEAAGKHASAYLDVVTPKSAP